MSEEIQEVGGEDVAPVPAEVAAEVVPSPAPGMGVAVYQGLPDVRMIVNPGNEVSPSGADRNYTEGEEITVDGPTAIALAAGGHATAVGPAEPAAEEPPAEEAPPAE